MKDKIAILGAGASGLGTYLGLVKKGFKNIDIYNSNFKNNIKLRNIEIDKNTNVNNKIKNYYSILKSLKNYGILNRKSYRGTYLDEIIISKKSVIYDSNIEYGLTNFWGGVLQTFDDDYIKRNHILKNLENIDDIYNELSSIIPITSNGSSNSFLNLISNRKKIDTYDLNNQLNLFLNDKNGVNNSISSIALDTKKINFETECLCIIGACPIHSIFSTENYFYSNKIKVLNDEIIGIDLDKSEIIFLNDRKKYDKIFVNLGPFNSQKILLKSINKDSAEKILVKDSSSFMFPIFFSGRINSNKSKNFFNLTNNIVNFKNDDNKTVTLQIYPPTRHILRTFLPTFAFSISSHLTDILLNRVLWAKCYLPEGTEKEKFFSTKEEGILENSNRKKIQQNQKYIFNKLSSILKKSDFFPINISINGKTSSHYSGCNNVLLDILNKDTSEISKNIILSDSTSWNSVPSQSPTFTIMANAMNISYKI